MQKLIKVIKLNNLQYNANRDPQFYRRLANEPFRLQVMLEGTGSAKARFEAEGEALCEQEVALPGTFECQFSFDSTGVRIGTLTLEHGGETYQHELRLDVMDEAWVG